MSLHDHNKTRRRKQLEADIKKYLKRMQEAGRPVLRIQLREADCALLGGAYAGVRLENIEGEK